MTVKILSMTSTWCISINAFTCTMLHLRYYRGKYTLEDWSASQLVLKQLHSVSNRSHVPLKPFILVALCDSVCHSECFFTEPLQSIKLGSTSRSVEKESKEMFGKIMWLSMSAHLATEQNWNSNIVFSSTDVFQSF